jgi:hypothetical protein
MRLSGWLRNPAPVDRFYRWFIPLFWGFNHPFGGAEFRNHDHQRTWLSSSVVINRRFLKMELHKIIMDIKRVPFRIEIHMKSMINWGSSLKICVTYRGTTKIWRFNAMQSYRLYHFWVCLKAGFKKKNSSSQILLGNLMIKQWVWVHMGAQLVVMGVFENGIYPPTMDPWYVY